MKTIAIVNNKGGVGKTTSTQNIGAALSKAGKKVLLIDLDAQASLSKSFGLNADNPCKGSAAFILGENPPEDCIVFLTETLAIMPTKNELLSKEETIKSSPVFPFNLKLALEKLQAAFDYVLIDCPPALSGLTKIALVSCDFYFVPLQAEFLSYEGLRNFLQFSNEISLISPKVQLGGVFATRYNPKIRKRLSQDLINNAMQQLGEKFLQTYIRDNIALSEAQAMGEHIFDYAPKSNGASDYEQLTREIYTIIA